MREPLTDQQLSHIAGRGMCSCVERAYYARLSTFAHPRTPEQLSAIQAELTTVVAFLDWADDARPYCLACLLQIVDHLQRRLHDQTT